VAHEAHWFASLAGSARTHTFSEFARKLVLCRGQNRTGDTWFFRSCSWQTANSRLNASTTPHGYEQRQMVQQERTASRLPSLAVTPDRGHGLSASTEMTPPRTR
jgi:hypothetical protein